MKSSIQRWFMPWRWSRWVCAILLPLMILAYILSAVPLMRIANQVASIGPEEYRLVRWAYRPVWMLDANCGAVATLIDSESRMMDRILGEEIFEVYTHRGEPIPIPFRTIDIERRRYR